MSDDWIMVSRSRIFNDHVIMTGITIFGTPKAIGKYSYYDIVNKPEL